MTSPTISATCQPVYDEIVAHLAQPGASVVVATHYRATQYRRAEDFKLDAKGALYVRRGKRWDCIGSGGMILVSVRLHGGTE